MRVPEIELLWSEGCPSTPAVRRQLRAVMGELGIPAHALRVTEIVTDEDAAVERFPGSPTVRVDGADVAPPPGGDPPALTCRLYRLRDGRPSPTPDPADLRDALRRALRADQ